MSTIKDHGGGASGRLQRAPRLWRTDLQRPDVSVPEWVVVRLEHQVEGQPPGKRNSGDALTVPAGAIHTVPNVSNGNAAELATCVVTQEYRLLAGGVSVVAAADAWSGLRHVRRDTDHEH